MSTRESVSAPEATARLRTRLRAVLWMLAIAFLLGMGANLLGAPSEDVGVARVVSIVVIALHALVGVGIVATAIRASTAAGAAGIARRETMTGLIAVNITFLVGIATVMTGSGWLSFLMALGFLVAAGAYVVGAIGAARAARG